MRGDDRLLEDLGVKVDQIHNMTRRDLLHRNVDLIEHAGNSQEKTGSAVDR